MSQPMKGRRSRVSSPDKDSECCVSCKKKIGVKQDAVECQWCKHWEHRVCSKITDNEYKLLNSISVNIMFFCTSCCSKVPVALSLFDNGDRMDKKFEAMYSKFTKELELLSSSIRDNYNSMQENVSTLSTKVKDVYSQNVDLQEKLNHSKVLAAAVEQGDPVQVRTQVNLRLRIYLRRKRMMVPLSLCYVRSLLFLWWRYVTLLVLAQNHLIRIVCLG